MNLNIFYFISRYLYLLPTVSAFPPTPQSEGLAFCSFSVNCWLIQGSSINEEGWDGILWSSVLLRPTFARKASSGSAGKCRASGAAAPLNWSRAGVEFDGRAPGSHA